VVPTGRDRRRRIQKHRGTDAEGGSEALGVSKIAEPKEYADVVVPGPSLERGKAKEGEREKSTKRKKKTLERCLRVGSSKRGCWVEEGEGRF